MDEEMAATMGFSSFGASKKRKLDQTHSPKAKPSSSGANSTALGVRPKITNDGNDTSGTATGVPSIPKQVQKQDQSTASGLAAFLNRGQNLPDKPPSTNRPQETDQPNQDAEDATSMISFGGPPISRAELNALRTGVRADSGDTAYFLPSFVEDPWAKFRKHKA